MNNSKAFLVLVVFMMLITLFVGGLVGNTDLTPNQPSQLVGAPVSAPAAPVNRVVGGASIQSSICGQTYTVRRGDTLSRIAQVCGVTLEMLLAANPSITNPHLIRESQQINLPLVPANVVPSATPPAAFAPETILPAQPSAANPPAAGGLRPGAPLKLMMNNFQPETVYQVAVGPAGGEISVMGEARTDASGQLVTTINIPEAARPGEDWLVAVYQAQQPDVRATTPPFTIE